MADGGESSVVRRPFQAWTEHDDGGYSTSEMWQIFQSQLESERGAGAAEPRARPHGGTQSMAVVKPFRLNDGGLDSYI
jgi:hypothetical protein